MFTASFTYGIIALMGVRPACVAIAQLRVSPSFPLPAEVRPQLVFFFRPFVWGGLAWHLFFFGMASASQVVIFTPVSDRFHPKIQSLSALKVVSLIPLCGQLGAAWQQKF
ncbi:MAG: hypothetical protein ACI382_09100 [Alloprevotella sp.]